MAYAACCGVVVGLGLCGRLAGICREVMEQLQEKPVKLAHVQLLYGFLELIMLDCRITGGTPVVKGWYTWVFMGHKGTHPVCSNM
jgi:hypothetical protein